jgi:hypothetical protein
MAISAENILKLKNFVEDSKMTENEFSNKVFHDNQYVGVIEEKNEIKEIFVITAENLNSLNMNYKDLNEHFKDIKLYKQTLTEDFELKPNNLGIIDKHNDNKAKLIASKTSSNKANRSVKGADGRELFVTNDNGKKIIVKGSDGRKI